VADVEVVVGAELGGAEAELLGGSAGVSVQPAQSFENGSAAATSVAAAADAGDSVDLLKVVAAPMAKRFAPVLAAVAAAGAVGFLVGRRKRRSPAAVLADDLQAALVRLLS